MFEWVSDELQSNKLSISHVYPWINFLRKGVSIVCDYDYTIQIRSDLLKSLNERFGDVIENEVNLTRFKQKAWEILKEKNNNSVEANKLVN